MENLLVMRDELGFLCFLASALQLVTFPFFKRSSPDSEDGQNTETGLFCFSSAEFLHLLQASVVSVPK